MKMRHKKHMPSKDSPKGKMDKPMKPPVMADGDADVFLPKEMPPMMGSPPKRRLDRKRGGRAGC